MSSAKDPAARKAYQQRYRALHKERLRKRKQEYDKRRLLQNPDQIRALQTAYRRAHPEQVKATAKRHRAAHPHKRMLKSARKNAGLKQLPCDLTLADLPMPERCPILGLVIDYSYGTKGGKIQQTSPSVDRIDPTKGYVKGNIQVISMRANTLKNNATAEELRKVADYMDLFS